MPCNYSKYPDNWRAYIRPAILTRAGCRCEGSPAFPDCRAKDREPHPETGSFVILTIAHLNHDISDNDGMDKGGAVLPKEKSNLRAWCQRCHNKYDGKYRANNSKNRFKKEILNKLTTNKV